MSVSPLRSRPLARSSTLTTWHQALTYRPRRHMPLRPDPAPRPPHLGPPQAEPSLEHHPLPLQPSAQRVGHSPRFFPACCAKVHLLVPRVSVLASRVRPPRVAGPAPRSGRLSRKLGWLGRGRVGLGAGARPGWRRRPRALSGPSAGARRAWAWSWPAAFPPRRSGAKRLSPAGPHSRNPAGFSSTRIDAQRGQPQRPRYSLTSFITVSHTSSSLAFSIRLALFRSRLATTFTP